MVSLAEKMLTINQGEQYLISPITKEKIPANSISAHTKYGRDPALSPSLDHDRLSRCS
jgi:hypothetical protein